MKKIDKVVFLPVIILIASLGFFNFAAPVYAMTPTLSLSATGSGDNVQINVTGDANASVLLFAASQSVVLGNTDSSGNFSTVISSATYGIVSNSAVYVKTNGINGTMSNQVVWPYVQSTTASTLTLSQTALLLNTGQTSTITANANYLYILSNSNPSIANINLYSNQITVQALTYGSTVANICIVGSTTNCSSITVTVQNSSAQQLAFSQNNFSIISGQSISVTITGGSGYYTVSNNSNASAVQTSLSGSVITLTGENGAPSGSGAASITVCTTDMNYCGIINVSATTVTSTAVTFSQTNPVVPIGQSTTVTIYGGTGTNFYVSSNSNPSVVQANINGNILTLIGNASTGTSTINVCAYAGTCGSLIANVTSGSSNGPLSLSQSTVSILAGQSSNITILGGSTPYSISSSTPNIFNGAVNGNILTIYGVNPGSATANICASVGCTTLYVTINSTTSSANSPTFSQNNVLLNVGQQTTVYITGTDSYYVSNNSNSSAASAQISGSSVIISAIEPTTALPQGCTSTSGYSSLTGQSCTTSGTGTDNISICQSGGQCAILYVTVSGATNTGVQLVLNQTNLSLNAGQSATVYITGNGSYYVSNNSNSSVASAQISGGSVIVSAIGAGTATISVCQSGGQCASLYVTVSGTAQTTTTTPAVSSTYVFSRYLGYGDMGSDVLMLQQLLVRQGFLSASPTGHYGPATVVAIKSFQSSHGIRQTGNVGSLTLAALNQILSSTTATSTATATTANAQQISAIQQEIQQLLAQVAQMQGQ